MRRSRRRAATPAEPWSRRKLLAVAGIAVLLVGLTVVGATLLVVQHLGRGKSQKAAGEPRQAGTGAAASRTGSPAGSAEDALAAKPMKVLSQQAFQPHALAVRVPPVLDVPRSTTTGPVGVPSGFPHSAAGALAQMAAIDQAALQSKQLSVARQILAAWVLPGGPSPQSWSRVQDLREAMGPNLSDGSAASWALTFTPIMGQIKGQVGADFVLPCVDYELDGTVTSTARVGVGLCARMVWHAGRWMIGPGGEPYPAPSAWPDTDDAIDAGYADLRHG